MKETDTYSYEEQNLNAGLVEVAFNIDNIYELIAKGDFEGAGAFGQAAVRSFEENDRGLENEVDEILWMF